MGVLLVLAAGFLGFAAGLMWGKVAGLREGLRRYAELSFRAQRLLGSLDAMQSLKIRPDFNAPHRVFRDMASLRALVGEKEPEA